MDSEKILTDSLSDSPQEKSTTIHQFCQGQGEKQQPVRGDP